MQISLRILLGIGALTVGAASAEAATGAMLVDYSIASWPVRGAIWAVLFFLGAILFAYAVASTRKLVKTALPAPAEAVGRAESPEPAPAPAGPREPAPAPAGPPEPAPTPAGPPEPAPAPAEARSRAPAEAAEERPPPAVEPISVLETGPDTSLAV